MKSKRGKSYVSHSRKEDIYPLYDSKGYKPVSLPRAFKVLQGKTGEEERTGKEMSEKMKTSPVKNKIGGIFIPVRRIKEAQEWYCQMLGLPNDGEIQFGHLVTLPLDGINLVLDEMPMWGGNTSEGPPAYQTPAFMFHTDDLPAAYQFMRSIGAELVTEIQDNHWFAFKDPDGNLLMMCQS